MPYKKEFIMNVSRERGQATPGLPHGATEGTCVFSQEAEHA